MSEEAFQIYEEALKEQHNRNEARRIRTRVSEARRNPHPAAVRWPFELFQNALDAGPRKGRSSVTIRISRRAGNVLFEHDGAPFTSIELAALLSGGSSKEFESELTTGRFGTGFLVTHVLSEQTSVRGLLSIQGTCEHFELVLDRSGDEEAILENTRSCNGAIRAAKPLLEIDGVPSATFEYQIRDENTLDLGLDALKQALPYLYLTRQSLGDVELQTEDQTVEKWSAGEITLDQLDNGYVEHRSLRVTRNGVDHGELRAYRFMVQPEGAGALLLTTRADDSWEVCLPPPNAPRVYREYPLRGSGFLPFEFVIDGKFDPDQERTKLLMSEGDKQTLQSGVLASVVAVKYAFQQNWRKRHLLARVSRPATSFDTSDPTELQWWGHLFAALCRQFAKLPIIETLAGPLPAISAEGRFADFVVPRLLPSSTEDETTVARMWPLVEAASDLFPPRQELALDWTDIAQDWHALGLGLNLVTVSGLASTVRKGAERLDQLKVTGNPKEWLTNFVDVVGECWTKRAGVDAAVFTGILPNQNNHLCNPKDLIRDANVSEELKDICSQMGRDVRANLLLCGLADAAIGPLSYAPKALADAIEKSWTEADVLSEAIKHLDRTLPEDEDCDDRTLIQQKASVRLLNYLWEKQGRGAAAVARQVPLISSKHRVVRWSRDRIMMAPVSSWEVSARPYALAYPPQRVLEDLYVGANDELPNVVSALVDWGIVIADPVSVDTPTELKDRRLAAICPSNVDGVVVAGEQLSQIALLQPEVLNRCQEGLDEARALLGLVLCHVAPRDTAWSAERVVKGKKGGKEVEVTLRPALWLADLKFRTWVPMVGEDGKIVKMPANASTLKDLLDPTWLVDNDAAITLLSEAFGFDALELRLLGIAPDTVKRQDLRNGLAKLVESAGGDAAIYASLAAEVDAKKRKTRDIQRCRKFGLAVQDAIKAAMEQYGLRLKLVDRGFDYEVRTPEGDVFSDSAMTLEVGPYLLEIKATTREGARLTSTQADMASHESSRYVLCVVDLRNVSEEALDSDWTASAVQPLAKIIDDIGGRVEETCHLVQEARSSSVGIRNEAALRYEVPIAVWQGGISISDWVARIGKGLAKSVAQDA